MKIKKNKKKVNGGYLTFTTGDLDLNMKRFNQAMGTDGLGDASKQPHIPNGDVLPNGPVADSSSDGASDAGSSDGGATSGEGGGVSESMNNELQEELTFDQQLENEYNARLDKYAGTFGYKTGAELKAAMDDDPELYQEVIEYDDGDNFFDLYLNWWPDEEGFAAEDEYYHKPLKDLLTDILRKKKESLKEALEEIDTIYKAIEDTIKDHAATETSKLALFKTPDDNAIKYFAASGEKGTADEVTEHFNFSITGGLNGSGHWADYFTDLGACIKDLQKKTGLEPVVIDVFSDVLDDVFTVEFNLFNTDAPLSENILTEDLIVIEPTEAKEKLNSLVAQIKEQADNEDVKKSLLELLNIYLFQTAWDARHQEENNCDLGLDEWEEIAAFHKAETEDEDEEPLEEAVNYYDQVEKMRALENGTRGFNAKAASDEKLRVNRQVCIDKGFHTALKIVEDEMYARGLLSRQVAVDKTLILNANNIKPNDLLDLNSYANDIDVLIGKSAVDWPDALKYLLLALFSGNKVLADAIKDKILANFKITVSELKDLINKNIADANVSTRVKNICKTTKVESLTEDSHTVQLYKDWTNEPTFAEDKDDVIENIKNNKCLNDGEKLELLAMISKKTESLTEGRGFATVWSEDGEFFANCGGGKELDANVEKAKKWAVQLAKKYHKAMKVLKNGCDSQVIWRCDAEGNEIKLNEEAELQEAKRYVKRYYVRPQNIFCSNKEDILKALLRVDGENCSIYSLKDLPDHNDVHLLKPSDIIYYYDDGILYDKNHVKVMDYDLNVKHEEERKKFADVDKAPTAEVNTAYDDRLTYDDLQDKEAVANFKAINSTELKQ